MCTSDRCVQMTAFPCVSRFKWPCHLNVETKVCCCLDLFGMWWGLCFLPRHPFQGIAGKPWVFNQAIGRPCRSWSSLEATFPGKFVVCQHHVMPWTALDDLECSVAFLPARFQDISCRDRGFLEGLLLAEGKGVKLPGQGSTSSSAAAPWSSP